MASRSFEEIVRERLLADGGCAYPRTIALKFDDGAAATGTIPAPVEFVDAPVEGSRRIAVGCVYEEGSLRVDELAVKVADDILMTLAHYGESRISGFGIQQGVRFTVDGDRMIEQVVSGCV